MSLSEFQTYIVLWQIVLTKFLYNVLLWLFSKLTRFPQLPNLLLYAQADLINFVKITVEHKLSALTKFLKLLTQNNWFVKLFSELCKNSVCYSSIFCWLWFLIHQVLVEISYWKIPVSRFFFPIEMGATGRAISYLFFYPEMCSFFTSILFHKGKKAKVHMLCSLATYSSWLLSWAMQIRNIFIITVSSPG